MSLIRDWQNCTGFALFLGSWREGFIDLASLVLLDVLGRLKLLGVSETCTNWLDKSRFPVSNIKGGLGGGEIVKIEVSLSYEWVIGSWWNLIYRKNSCLRYYIFDSDWIRGHKGWRAKRKYWKPEILENAYSGEIGIKLDWNNKHKF